jgi:ABC-type polysaccharide/polyol phosphate transport system ATPase subunit
MSLIELKNVALEYPILENRGVTLKEFVVKGLFRKALQKRRTIEALQDITLTVRDGERVGIIGFNGAGKSTLLRTIGGVYPVARGELHTQGSVCALFDITSGFETEATGMQNIYYRSYLQGDTPQQVRAKVERIAEFSELGDFLSLPVRCYSSGMFMRLAFSVATANEPDILLVDEVFSAGDLLFKRKAEARMKEYIQSAKIVVLVGHDLKALAEFCTRVVWLHQGRVRLDGPTRVVLDRYVNEAQSVRQAA